LSSCESASDEDVLTPEKPIPIEKEARIESDTTLYAVSVKEWHAASENTRESNCAGIISSWADTMEVEDDESFNKLTRNLCSCIHDVTYGMPTMNDNAIMTEARRCLDTMGYREAGDSLTPN